MIYQKCTIEGWKVTNPFHLLTETMVGKEENDIERIVNEQNRILGLLGYDLTDKAYSIKFGRMAKPQNETINDAIQLLALKDGADLVLFENGNIGFVGYYHGFNENYFEIIGESEEEEE